MTTHSETTSAQSEQPIRFAGAVLGEYRHVCAFFQSADEEYRTLLPFIQEGLERGEKVFHIVDPKLHQDHLQRLESSGIDTAATQGSGQLEVHDWYETYLRDGRFDKDRMLNLIPQASEQARQQGYAHFNRVSAMARVVRFHRTGGPEVLRIEEVEVGEPGPQEIRVRVEAIGLNRAEAAFRSGQYLEQPNLPARLGYEASAIVEGLGSGVKAFEAGEAVCVIPAFSMNKYGVYATQAIVPVAAGEIVKCCVRS